MEDSRIIDLYFERSENAISETNQKYGSYCNTIAFNILQNHEDSEECKNDTYLKLWNTIPPTRPSHFKAFIAKITRNLAINLYDKHNAQKRGSGVVELALDELEECIPSPAGDTSEDQMVTECLNKFLRSLNSEQRTIFIRRYFHMTPTADIAEQMNIKDSKVRVTLKRLRDKLKVFFEKEGIIL